MQVMIIDQISKIDKFGNQRNIGVLCHFWELHTLRRMAKFFTVPYSNITTNIASVTSDKAFTLYYLLINQNFRHHPVETNNGYAKKI